MNTTDHKSLATDVVEKAKVLREAVTKAEEPLRYAAGAILIDARMRLTQLIDELDRFEPFTRQLPLDKRLDELAGLLIKVAREQGPYQGPWDTLCELLDNASETPSACTWRAEGPTRGHMTAHKPDLDRRLRAAGVAFQVPLHTDRGERLVTLIDLAAYEAAPHAVLWDAFERDSGPGCFVCGLALPLHDAEAFARKADPRKSHTIRNVHVICGQAFDNIVELLSPYEDFVASERADAEAGRSGSLPERPQIEPPDHLKAEVDVPLKTPTVEAKSDFEVEMERGPKPRNDDGIMSRTPPSMDQARELDEPEPKGRRGRGK